MKKLILSADDYGPVPFINNGIEKALEKKSINTVSVLMNPPYIDNPIGDKIVELKSRFPFVKIGIHLSITSGKPVSDPDKVPSLLKTNGSGEFMDIDEFFYDQVSLFELQAELRNQIDLFPNNIPIDHLSCHHSILTMFKDFLFIYANLAFERGIPMRNPMVISNSDIKWFKRSKAKREGLFTAINLIDDISNASLISAARHINQLERMLNSFPEELKKPLYTIDNFYKKGTKKNLRKILEKMPDSGINELILHLGQGNDSEAINGINPSVFRHRQKEFETITSLNENQAFLTEHDVQLSCYSDI